MWREFIRILEPDARFTEAATEAQIFELEKILNMHLPRDLRDLLEETNGVTGKFGLQLIWSVEEIGQRNTKMRTEPEFMRYFMPFDHLIFFADAGNGDVFAFSVIQGNTERPDIFVWNHENDSRSWVAPSLKVFLEWWLSGKLSI